MTIDNEKLDLEMAISQVKKEKEKLFQSLKRRKEVAIQMNDHLYIEDLHPSSSLDEANDAIKELLEKNGSLQEVRKLRIEQEIRSVRLCEVKEKKNNRTKDIEGKSKGIQNPSAEKVDFIDQLTNANDENMNLRSENEIL